MKLAIATTTLLALLFGAAHAEDVLGGGSFVVADDDIMDDDLTSGGGEVPAAAIMDDDLTSGDDAAAAGDDSTGDDGGLDIGVDADSEALARPNDCCPNEFGCPKNSFRAPDLECYKNFNHCECDYGYVMDNGECMPDTVSADCMNNYECPPNSWRRYDWKECYDEFESCQCDYGYIKDYKNETCVPDASEGCANDIQCPQFAWRMSGQTCYNSIEDDCWCDEKYKMLNETCVPLPTGPVEFGCSADGRCLTCPNYSKAKEGVFCPQTTDDCMCAESFEMMEGECCMPKCPYYSEPIESDMCVTSPDQCKCMDGYYADEAGDCVCMETVPYANMEPMTPDACVQDITDCECIEGHEPDDSGTGCVLTCTSDYQCPTHSTRKPDLACYVSMDDCECESGWAPFGDMCVRSQCTWERRPNGECCHSNTECESGACAQYDENDRTKICCPYGAAKVDSKWMCSSM